MQPGRQPALMNFHAGIGGNDARIMVCFQCRRHKVKCVPVFNSSSCKYCLSKKLVCVPADSSAKRSFSARKTECGYASSNSLDDHLLKDKSLGETPSKSSAHDPPIQNSSERCLAGISRSTQPEVEENVWLATSACQNHGMAKVLDFTGDEYDADAHHSLGIPCELQTETTRDVLGNGLTEGVSHDYDQYSHLMLWLNDSMPKKRQRHLSFLVSSLLNEEVIINFS